MKARVVEDSSFLIATIREDDPFHEAAASFVSELVSRKASVQIVIPSVVFFETIVKLIQRGVPEEIVQKRFWDYLYTEEVLNVTLLETSAFRFAKYVRSKRLRLKTSDLLIALTAIEFEASLLTFDVGLYRGMRDAGYFTTYLCSEIGERKRFLESLPAMG